MQGSEVLDMRPVIQRMGAAVATRRIGAHHDATTGGGAGDDGGLSGDNESLSSRVSDKNLGDFEDENSVDEEMLQLAQTNHILHQQQQLANMASLYHHRLTAPRLTARQQREEARLLGTYKLVIC